MHLATRYRPTSFDDVVGQGAAVTALRKLKEPRCTLIHGPSGCGKTTLARILAREVLDCESPQEVNGSDRTGVESWRETIRAQGFTSLTSERKVIIIDECQELSKSSWSVLLKPMEDAPPGWHWILCTTDLQKVPVATRNRCLKVPVKALSVPDIEEVLGRMLDGQCLDPSTSEMKSRIRVVAKSADGCPREALSNWELTEGALSVDDVRLLLEQEKEGKDGVSKLCGIVLKGGNLDWKTVRGFIGSPTGEQAHKLRVRIANYLAGAALKSGADRNLLGALELFSEPYPHETARASLVLSLGGLIHGNDTE